MYKFILICNSPTLNLPNHSDTATLEVQFLLENFNYSNSGYLARALRYKSVSAGNSASPVWMPGELCVQLVLSKILVDNSPFPLPLPPLLGVQNFSKIWLGWEFINWSENTT